MTFLKYLNVKMLRKIAKVTVNIAHHALFDALVACGQPLMTLSTLSKTHHELKNDTRNRFPSPHKLRLLFL